ncbi:unnamed protein product [Rotaria sp. Silwood1]|nr:unnamed protein product [Rotaria sp. Silwood1]CAF4687831.1 unnamed protein product [Rotaria sp. Silwood1]CAF4844081.1 unnamed protein product [Rotaria sp. Silwood1]
MGHNKTLTIENLNPRILDVEYLVRNPITIHAYEGNHNFPFDRVIRTNIDDFYASGNQISITYIRQFVAGCTYPELMESPNFPLDIKQKVERLLSACGGKNLGSYSETQGIVTVREDIASYIQQRDDYPSDANNIYLCNGATDGINTILLLLMNNNPNKPSGIMISVPQYPLYSATLSEYGAHPIECYLDEDNNWSLSMDELERSLNESKDRCESRGQVLSQENIENAIRFANKHRLFILADEVYQENVYLPDSKFVSFKKVLMSLSAPYNQLELASFHSASKGWYGECGSRCGYYELINIDKDVKVQLNILQSARPCVTSWGQACYGSNLQSMHFHALKFQKKAIEYAKSKNMTPDEFYCFQLLGKTGICVLSGNDFKQRPGTYHLRTTFLPPVDQMKEMVERFHTFHMSFLHEWK